MKSGMHDRVEMKFRYVGCLFVGQYCSVKKEPEIRSAELKVSSYPWNLPNPLGRKHLPERQHVPVSQQRLFPNNQKSPGQHQSLWW